MKVKIYLLAAFLLLLLGISCSKDALDYQNYLNDTEKVYPGFPANIKALSGNYRVKLEWNPSPDPTVVKYKIFWNSRADSMEFSSNNHNPAETVSVIIPNLTEYTYSFTIYSYDSEGNRSVPVNVNNVKVYGDSYKSGLTNRFLSTTQPYTLTGNSIILNFLEPDTINTGTLINYTLINGTEASATLAPDQSSIRLDNYKAGTKIYYQSGYIPVRGSIDNFTPATRDSITNILIPLDKSTFTGIKLPNDVGTYSSETSLSKLWNGNTSPTGYPNIFHSDGSHPLPHHFTFDLGKPYANLSQFEIIGRDCCNNPTKFEIWGIADLTGAITTLSGNDEGWKQESQQKGWVLLKEVSRSDDGIGPYKVALGPNLPPVSYIRIRVLENASGDPNYSNISEITFWQK
ncbi:DUF4998 domain-containing protein [Desertivirga arenae]|uniref:DUF4998 domain-containing protein n=1 Tax=Desertivirga arenae TaxID=2810309 RepID=UPI001A961186|nr:DUF4998 domain-containing protein [Pedobacter sp. SYSU D00823]